MSATPNAQSSAPTISLATLRAVLAKGQAAHPELAAQMERAAVIVALRRIDRAVSGQVGCYWVQSKCQSREYWVCQSERGYRGDQCSCPDYQQRGGPCKHTIAVRLLQACERRAARMAAEQAPEPIPFPTPTLDPDAPIPFELTPEAVTVLDAPEPQPAA